MQQIYRCSRQGYRSFCSSASVLENVLTSSNKERTIVLLKKLKPLRIARAKTERKAAVCVPMCTVDGQLSFLYTLRSTSLPSHQGEVSFPGGMWQDGDSDIVETGLRELNEELSVPPSSIDVWGTLIPMLDYVSDVFSIPLKVLSNPLFQRYTQYRVPATPTKASFTYTLPVFLGGRYKVWGLTALATDLCLQALLHEHYTPAAKQVIDKTAGQLNTVPIDTMLHVNNTPVKS
ncbi:nucleoside diphosphate-linked moiety X motif 8-like [Anneissia japonica]|uniref:nucleoside diphosphate-linked moiety X motif 8-like n=1 Tax=Anneissia japonica TaxID=1529436 RepID=UPI00142560F1|nr:nucleoside diphosphate-linked moiety X motif 8-like [Anneissia japonica]